MKCDLSRALDVLFPTYKRRGFIGVEAQAYETICRHLSVKPLSDFGFDGHAAPADAPAALPQRMPPWWKILADNWRGRNGNSTTGDSVRNSCADELEKVAASHAHTRPECGDAAK